MSKYQNNNIPRSYNKRLNKSSDNLGVVPASWRGNAPSQLSDHYDKKRDKSLEEYQQFEQL